MKPLFPHAAFRPCRRPRGFTLIEVTLVISVLLGFVAVLFVGVTAYKRGSNRALCIENIATMQKVVRSYGNLYEKLPGDTVPGLKDELIGPGRFLEVEPVCPGRGVYTFGGNVMPAPGSVYLNCTIADHVPSPTASW